jgi:hypothetical protein
MMIHSPGLPFPAKSGFFTQRTDKGLPVRVIVITVF